MHFKITILLELFLYQHSSIEKGLSVLRVSIYFFDYFVSVATKTIFLNISMLSTDTFSKVMCLAEH